MSPRTPPLDKEEFVARARFRHRLRLFERFTEEACARAGVTLPQYLLLLQVCGRPERDWATVGELADCLVVKPHTAAELVGRCEAAGLVRRQRDTQDQRRVRVLLTVRGRRIVERVAQSQRGELSLLLDHVREAIEPRGAPAGREGRASGPADMSATTTPTRRQARGSCTGPATSGNATELSARGR